MTDQTKSQSGVNQAKQKGFVRIAVIGTGGMGRGHCQSVQSVNHARLAAVCDTNESSAKEAGREWNVPYFTDHKALIDAGLCDMVMIATPHPFHMPVAVDCMNAGLHVISEKPLTESIDTAEKMVETAKKNKVVLAVMFQLRFMQDFMKAKKLIDEGLLGEIQRTMLIDLRYRSQSYYDSGKWRATWKGEGGGVMMNQSPHFIDLFVQLAGMPNELLGIASTRMHEIEVEDQAEALLRYPNGGIGYMLCSTCEVTPGQMIEIHGDKGKLFIRDGKLSFFKYSCSIKEHIEKSQNVWDTPEVWEVPIASRFKPVEHGDYENHEPVKTDDIPRPAVVIQNTVDHILFGAELSNSGESGLGSLELANAVTLSSHEKQWVKLPISRSKYAALLDSLRKTSTGKKKVVHERRETDPRVMG